MSELKKPESVEVEPTPEPGSFDAWLASLPKDEVMRMFDARRNAVRKNPAARLKF